jgi:DNA-binding CsgD family transcriptional regulator/tetratricopeptide (TPR) repeat protein
VAIADSPADSGYRGQRRLEQNKLLLFGREAELAYIDDSLDGVLAGRSQLVIVEGETGIGKTRLLAACFADARARDFTVLHACGDELGQHIPFGVVVEMLELRSSSPDPRCAALSRLLRGAKSDRKHLEFRILDDALSIVEELAIESPLAIAMDDLQWVDSSSLLALAFLARQSAPLRLAVIVAVRPPPWPCPVNQFFKSVARLNPSRLHLGPLSDQAVTALVTALAGGQPGPHLRQLIDGAAGNPLFVRELIEALNQEGSLQATDGAQELIGKPLPIAFQELVVGRVNSLPQPTADALRLASVFGSDFACADLATLLDRSAVETAATLGPALHDGLLGSRTSRLAFKHALVRDAVYDRMPRSVRSALHRQIGGLLARRGADATQVATHFGLGVEDDNTEALEWLLRVAREAVSRSPGATVELLDRVIALAAPNHPYREQMLAERATALACSGREDEAIRECRKLLLTYGGGLLEPRLRLCLAHALLVQGRWAESARELEGLAGEAGLEQAERVRLLGDAALARAHNGELQQAVVLAHEARRLAERLGDDLGLSVALSSLAVVARFEARHSDSVDLSREALAMGLRSQSPDALLRPTAIWLGLGLVETDRFEEALAVLQQGRRRCEEADLHWQLPLYHDAVGTMQFYAGDWDDAVAEMETCIATAEDCGAPWWAVPANCILAYIAIHRDQDSLAEGALTSAERAAESSTNSEFGSNGVLWVRGLSHEAHGDVHAALSVLTQGWQATARSGFLPQYLIVGSDMVRVALAAGRPDLARAAAKTVEEVASRTGVGRAVGIGLLCRGLAEGDPSRLLEAVARLKQSPRRADLACAFEAAGACLAIQPATTEAVALLDQALSEYRRMGAHRDAARVVAILRRLGVRRGGAGHAQRPAQGWAALTPTELRVTGLASQGLNNPEIGRRLFISRRTVGTHLSHIFNKLEVSSRVELAAMSRERA